MGTTTNRGLPYPDNADVADVDGDMQALADAVDAAPGILQFKTSIIAAEQSRGTGLDYLGTPDKVTGIDVPANGIIAVLFMALVKSSSGGESKAAIVIDGEPVSVYYTGNGAVVEQEAYFASDVNEYKALLSNPAGLDVPAGGPSTPVQASPADNQIVGSIDSSTGEVVGGPCLIRCGTAGAKEVGIHFGGDSGTVTAKERKLWVWSMLPKN